jgi:Tannase and feruloyl esterase
MWFAQTRASLKRPWLTVAAIAAIGPIILATAPEAAAAETGAILPVTPCAALEKSDLTPLDARITAAATVTRNGHPFCDVKGYVSPVTQFEALLPQETWRGDYLQQGCGGLCGKADVSLDDPSRTSGYQAPYAPLSDGEMVVASDDQGHETASNADALWARNDLRLRAVFGYSSEHQLARTITAVIHTYYGRKPTYSYFSGVSDGGHEALVLAQRYPADFDGIIAGAPANNWAPLAGLVAPWVAAANRNAQGGQILTAEKLPALHAAVMAACADQHGVIEDPRACAFDPACAAPPAQTGRTA